MEPSQIPHNKPRVLVVDDDTVQRALLRELLHAEGCEVIEAESGSLALLQLKYDLNFDLILLDILMPQVNGLQVLIYLKGSPATMHIPVVMLTGVTGSMERRQAMACGASDYVKKSASMLEVRQRVKEQLTRTGWRQAEQV